MTPIKVLVAGLGNMGMSHALAYQKNPGFEIVGLVNRSKLDLPDALAGRQILPSFDDALAELKPELCSVNTYSDSHAAYAIKAMEAGAHVFVEKPLATTVADAERVVACARANGRKLVIGYILRHHPSWVKLIELARGLGGPFVFRMNLNQQSSGKTWATHKALMQTTPPIVDCGVHYVDVMCQITDARDVQLRPSAGDVRRWLGRLVRGRLGTDDVGNRLLREGRDFAERLCVHCHGPERQVR
jgi:predicted dehydrogenase